MRHYIPMQTEFGWAVAYLNHRGEMCAVMECGSFAVAYRESATMTLNAIKQALAAS